MINVPRAQTSNMSLHQMMGDALMPIGQQSGVENMPIIRPPGYFHPIQLPETPYACPAGAFNIDGGCRPLYMTPLEPKPMPEPTPAPEPVTSTPDSNLPAPDRQPAQVAQPTAVQTAGHAAIGIGGLLVVFGVIRHFSR